MPEIENRKFLFKCAKCEMIISVTFDDEQDLIAVDEDKITLECPCGGQYLILRN